MDRSGPAPTGAALRRFVHLALDDGVPQGSGRLARRPRAFLGSEHSAASGRHLSARTGAGMRSDLPRFSLRLHQGLTPQACRALAASAEAHGFHTLWFAENPFGRAILPTVAACAADTSRVRIGLGILNPYQHHPTLIAQEAAVLDELSAGRVRLGIGSGIGQRIVRLGTRYRPLAALNDTVQIVRGLLRHETVGHRGHAFSADRVALEFAAPRPDIHLAAMADRSLAL